MVSLTLYLANELTGAAIPDKLVSQVNADRVVPSLARIVRRDLFWKTDAETRVLEKHRFHLKSKERWRDKIGCVLDIALTPRVKDCAFVSLPDSLFPLYYILRPVRLLTEYGLGPLKRVFRSDEQEQRDK
jgi:hypothetical protein